MRFLLFILSLFFSKFVYADRVVLIQGYLADSSSWVEAGVTQNLHEDGWHYKGEYFYTSDGARLIKKPAQQGQLKVKGNGYYLVSLPTEASIQQQAFYLVAYLKKIRHKHPNERLILIGHSAGGVLARYVMVRNPALKISQLITVASPHLGTDSAEFGKLAGDSPFAFLAPMIGAGALNRSQGLYSDLLPEMPDRFLFWLNRQTHPEAEYISIVRDRESTAGVDFIVPQQSQHLENVAALKFRAISYIVQGAHALNASDADLIMDLINERRVQPL